jgi:hypothetical protein
MSGKQKVTQGRWPQISWREGVAIKASIEGRVSRNREMVFVATGLGLIFDPEGIEYE